MSTLAPGQNAPLGATGAEVCAIEVTGDVDLTALVLSADGKVSGDTDMVFFNQPSAPGLRLDGARLLLDVTVLRPGAERVAIVASPARQGAVFGDVPGVRLTVVAGREQHEFEPGRLTSETALVLVEVYQRNGAWKVRAVGQGYSDGLAGLARDFGVVVDDEPATASTPAPAPSPAPSRVRFTQGEDQLPVDLRKRLNLRKAAVAVVLERHRAQDLRARVVVVLDVSGSTAQLYKKGVFARAVERVVPVAAQLDDDGELQAWAMGSRALQLPDLTVAGMPAWLARYGAVRATGAGYANNEVAALEAVRSWVAEQPGSTPTLVLWFHDGGVTDDRGVERAIRAADRDPVFWQFVGLGRSNYGILARLDDLAGRAHDNVGFFALDDIDAVEDGELYERLLGEFPDWARSYYGA